QISKDGYMRNFECKLRTKQGRIIFALIYSSIIEVDGDKCMLTAGIDITQRKKAEEDLKTAYQKLQQEGPFSQEFPY
ncbi:MAG: PAS domain S-box protein, partial [Syntrophomonadaceae bacterium]|nr:PAS domain S-box protein [Syntrophomonadaceae bacterium]